MPVLYLLDSIVKNFGGQYMKLFSHKLIFVFMAIFDKVSMVKLPDAKYQIVIFFSSVKLLLYVVQAK